MNPKKFEEIYNYFRLIIVIVFILVCYLAFFTNMGL